jgi:serine/threonine protein kinase/WD40 repeat protein
MDTSDERNPVEFLAEEFLDRVRRGERPRLGEYLERHPELADEIRDLFPALLMIEDLGESSGGKTSAPVAGDGAAVAARLQRLGDYRILREIGRGGMGVVYEAEQESLGRRVAVKVLSPGALFDPKQVRRFEREAKAAAKLHHTNIVPVFGVGRHESHHYYVMQFIAGPGLDAVLRDLRRLRQSPAVCEAPVAAVPPARSAQILPTSVDVARSLLSGGFAANELAPTSGPAPADDSATEPNHAVAPALRPDVDEDMPERGAASGVLAESSALSATSHPDRKFYRGIANIGIQVALALEFANRRGILHRDVKPSNILLDARGHAWVADFGLAKTAETDDLTDTGDIIGTIRYMAPERFSGQCDARSDVYSLGLTLYELAALQPAYDGADRHVLFERVLHEEPTPLSKVAPNLPRDLDTIIAKAIAREPSVRYRTAGALADDLQRFVDDRPITARRVSPAERLARWCRRNPMVAALLGVAALLLCMVATVSSVGYFQTSAALSRERTALSRERTALAGERAARQKAVESLYHAQVGEARALRTARVGGYRGKVLDLLGRAARLDTPERDPGELRREASAALGDFVGLQPVIMSGFNSTVTALTIHPCSEWIALGMADGTVRLHDPATGIEWVRIAGRNARVTALAVRPDSSLLVGYGDGKIRVVEYEPRSRTQRLINKPKAGGPIYGFYLVVGGKTKVVVSSPTAITISDLDESKPIILDLAGAVPGRRPSALAPDSRNIAISPDGRLAAAGLPFSEPPYLELVVWELAAPHRVRHVALGALSGCSQCLFSPDSTRLAVGGDLGFAVIDTTDLSPRLSVSLDSATSAAFGPGGKTLAVATITGLVRLWSLTTNRELAELRHRRSIELRAAISADGRTLASVSFYSASVWNLAGANERTELAGHASGVTGVTFSPDGATLASTSKDSTVKVWEPATGRPRRTLGGYPSDVQVCAFSPDGALLATGSYFKGAIRIWDVRSWREVYAANEDAKHIDNITGLAFLRGTGAELGLAVSARGSGLGIWRLKRTEDARLALLPILGRPGSGCSHFALSHDSELAAYVDSETAVKVWDIARARGLAFSGPRLPLGWHSLAFRSKRELVYISRDGVAVVWDVTTNRLVRAIGRPATFGGFHIAVSPDGRWLAAEATPSSVAIADLERGEIVYTFREERSPIWSLAWSPDARRLAVGLSDGGLVLWDLTRVRTLLAEAGIDAPPTSADLEEARRARPAGVLDLDRVAALHHADLELQAAAAAAGAARWEEAAAAFARIVAQHAPDCTDPWFWFEHAILRLAVGDVAGCRSVCAHMLEAFRKNGDPAWLESTAHAFVLAPQGPDKRALAVQLAENRVAVISEGSWSGHVLGLALHRAGRFSDADVQIRQCLDRDPGWECNVLNWLVLAMANQRLGRTDEAQRWLKRAETWVFTRLRDRPGGVDRATPEAWKWRDGILVHLLLREARALASARLPDLPADLFAPSALSHESGRVPTQR